MVLPPLEKAIERSNRPRGRATRPSFRSFRNRSGHRLAHAGFIEQQLGKEIARARRQNTALSLATIHLDEFTEVTKRHGLSATDAALKELARRMKKACRGSDFPARLAEDDRGLSRFRDGFFTGDLAAMARLGGWLR